MDWQLARTTGIPGVARRRSAGCVAHAFGVDEVIVK
jgi:hypothetical protein